jgi:hypothetical protein
MLSGQTGWSVGHIPERRDGTVAGDRQVGEQRPFG